MKGLASATKTAMGMYAAAWVVFLPMGLRAADTEIHSQQRGHALARTLCSNCHVIDDASSSPVPVGIPTFRAIANRAGQTGQRIRDVLIKPHTPMPEIQLSNDEVLNILAYLESLRTNDAVLPLFVPSGTKPKEPRPT